MSEIFKISIVCAMLNFTAIKSGNIAGIPVDSKENPRKELHVTRFRLISVKPSPEKIARKFDAMKIPFQQIDEVNWKDYPYKPAVKFRMAYSTRELYLQFHVREKYILAQCEPGDDSCWPSYDSCVEFFVSPGSDQHYYNFEFNSIGYCLIQSGVPGPGRKRLPEEVGEKVRTFSTMGKKPFGLKEGDYEWTLTVAIQLSIMGQQHAKLKDEVWTANFYKCGDNLPEKAYLTWNQVGTESPDFHRPDFFGYIQFK